MLLVQNTKIPDVCHGGTLVQSCHAQKEDGVICMVLAYIAGNIKRKDLIITFLIKNRRVLWKTSIFCPAATIGQIARVTRHSWKIGQFKILHQFLTDPV